MPQGSLFGGWEATKLEINLGFVPNKHSGWLDVSYLTHEGSTVAHRSVTWRTERDLAGLPDVLREIANHWLYGVPEELIAVVPQAVRRYLDEVPSGADSRY